jgi:ADP-heptose:LPS heptosyltransferase
MKFLVLQLKRIGDLILTTPALVALRERYPQAKITLAMPEGSASLIPALPAVDEVLIHRRRGRNAKLWTKLAMSHFDVCLDFTGTDRSAFFSFLSKAEQRVTFQWVKKSPYRLLFYNRFIDSSVRENHTVEHYLDLLKAVDIQARNVPVTLNIPSQARANAAELAADAGVNIDSPFAVVHPGTARPEKFWLPERWAAVMDHCQNGLGIPCLLTGSMDVTEREHMAAIQKRLHSPYRDLSGKLDLLTLAALIEKAYLLLSMDSAPVHLGAAFGTRQVSLFGETNPFHWRPRHKRAAVLLAGNEQPLWEFAPRFSRRPLSDLSTQAVISAIGSLLTGNVEEET